jgi:hypothetical protein
MSYKSNYKFISLKPADDNKHKYVVSLLNKDTGREKNIKFGAFGMNDYTITKDDKAKENYIARHRVRENWDDPSTAGFWAYHILWHFKTIKDGLKYTLDKYKLN